MMVVLKVLHRNCCFCASKALGGNADPIKMNTVPVARELAPVGLRSGPEILGALRTPTGASSLATG
ncbi:MAG: hypothetical protein KGI44_32235, partial [Pseudomonas sp.]|nr:hypothetical protein [Pseudomonas sp.]